MNNEQIEFTLQNTFEDEYCDMLKRKITIKWKDHLYSTYITSEYLNDKIIGLENLQEFFDAVFNQNKFYTLETNYNMFYCSITSLELVINVKYVYDVNLKPFKQQFIFVLDEEKEPRSFLQYIYDLILNKD